MQPLGSLPTKIWYAAYLLYDDFTTARAAGSVNGTSAEPVGGVRTVVDTNNKISIANGLLRFATGEVAFDRLYYDVQLRVLGKSFLVNVMPANALGGAQLGWDNNTVGTLTSCIRLAIGDISILSNAAVIVVGTHTATPYQICVTLRATGNFFFIKGGAFTNWVMLFADALLSGNMYPTISTYLTTAIYDADGARIPKRLYIPVPLQSDGFSASTTDGLGNPENNGTVGNSYSDVGTWGVTGGKRACSALSGGVGFSYLACSSTDVLIDATCTRTAGVTGIVARYADANNYLIAYHDGTNCKLDKVVAGVTTNLISAAATYSATAVLRLVLDGTAARLFYNNAAVGTVATTPTAGSLNHGLYTTDVNATFDNFIVWARGTGGEYSGLDTL